MGKLWLSLKRDRIYADIYYKGQKICTIKVSESNKGNHCVVDLETEDDVGFKIIKKPGEIQIPDESVFNKEEYNK